SAAASPAICSANRVLPTPPGPVRVRRRTSSRRSNASPAAASASRPMSGVGGIGKGGRWSLIERASLNAAPAATAQGHARRLLRATPLFMCDFSRQRLHRSKINIKKGRSVAWVGLLPPHPTTERDPLRVGPSAEFGEVVFLDQELGLAGG